MSLCISVIVNQKYQKYISSYAYCINKAYPEYFVKFFVTSKLNDKQNSIIKNINSNKIIIAEEAFKEYPKNSNELKSLRWIIDENQYNNCDNAYIGDVDILICKEDVDIEQQHLNHCKSTLLPYSNGLRVCKNKLTGLHFIKIKEYYDITKNVIKKQRENLLKGNYSKLSNEVLLYYIIKECDIGFPLEWFRPHHGLHIGLWRRGYTNLTNEFKEEYKSYYKYYLQNLKNDDIFIQIKKESNLYEIDNMEKSLSNYLNMEKI